MGNVNLRINRPAGKQAKISKFFFIIFLLLFFLAPRTAGAFSISPVKYAVTIAPGGEEVVSLTIKNDKTETVNYNLLVFGAEQDNNGYPVFKNNVSVAEHWVKPETEFVSISGKQGKTVSFLISIPEGAYPGFYYLGLAVKERNIDEGGVVLSGRLAAILSLQVAGEAREILQINKWEKSTGSGNWAFSAVLENKGNVDLPLRGEIVVRDWLKREAGRQSVYLGNSLLPNTTRNLLLNFSQEKLPWSGWYWTSLEINYGRTGGKAIKTALKWNLPVVGLILVIAVIIVLLAFLRIKHRRH